MGVAQAIGEFAKAVARFLTSVTELQKAQETRLAALEDKVSAHRRRMTDKDFDIDVTEERRGG